MRQGAERHLVGQLVHPAEEVVDDGFDTLVVSDDRIAIEPAGIELEVSQATTRLAILESRSEVFFAEDVRREDQLTVEFTRPAFREKIRVNASKFELN